MDKSKIANINPQDYTHLPHAEQDFEGHEQSDVAIRPLVGTLVAIAVVIVVSAVGLWGLFQLFKYLSENSSDNQPHSVLSQVEAPVRKVPPGYPELQGVPAKEQNANSPAKDMAAMRQLNIEILAGKKPMRPGLENGMPIDKAMDEALARGTFKTKSAATQPTASAK